MTALLVLAAADPAPADPALPCNPADIVCSAGQGLEVVGGAVLGEFAEAVQEGVGKVMASLATFWVDVPTPALVTDATGTPTDTVGFLTGSTRGYALALAVIAVIIGGTRMAWEQRAQPGRELVQALLTLVVVGGAGLTAVSILTQTFDAFADWIIDRSVAEGDFGANLTGLMGMDGVLGALGVFLTILLGICAIGSGIVQLALMIFRSAALIVVGSTLPLSASITNTDRGRAWFQRTVSWLLAFVTYKAAAAFVYSAAFMLAGENVFAADGLISIILGLTLLIGAVFALPALMKLAAPVVSAVAERGGGGGAFGGVVAALPTGAMYARNHSSEGSRRPTGAASTGPTRPTGGGAAAGAAGPWGAAAVTVARTGASAARSATHHATGETR